MALLGFLTRELCLPRPFGAGRVPPRLLRRIVLCRSRAWRAGRLVEAPAKSLGPVTGPRLVIVHVFVTCIATEPVEGTLGD